MCGECHNKPICSFHTSSWVNIYPSWNITAGNNYYLLINLFFLTYSFINNTFYSIIVRSTCILLLLLYFCSFHLCNHAQPSWPNTVGKLSNTIAVKHCYKAEHVECSGFESHPRQLIFLRKSDYLGGAVLLCLVCLFDLVCFFLSSFSSLI